MIEPTRTLGARTAVAITAIALLVGACSSGNSSPAASAPAASTPAESAGASGSAAAVSGRRGPDRPERDRHRHVGRRRNRTPSSRWSSRGRTRPGRRSSTPAPGTSTRSSRPAWPRACCPTSRACPAPARWPSAADSLDRPRRRARRRRPTSPRRRPPLVELGTVDGKHRRRVHQGRRQGPDLVQPEDPSTSPPAPPATWDDLKALATANKDKADADRGAWASSPAPHPAGRAPTGSRTSSCARPAPTSTTPGGQGKTKWTDPAIKAAFQTFGDVVGQHLRRRRDHQRHELRQRAATRCSRPRRAACSTTRRASSPASARSRPPRPAPTTTSSRSPTSTRRTPARSRARATCSACSTTRRPPSR